MATQIYPASAQSLSYDVLFCDSGLGLPEDWASNGSRWQEHLLVILTYIPVKG